MTIALIGSGALKFRQLRDNNGHDLDLLGDLDTVMDRFKEWGLKGSACYPLSGSKWFYRADGDIVEAEIAWSGSTGKKLLDIIENDPDTSNAGDWLIPSIHVLLALKLSHRYLRNSPHFLKTMDDIHLLRLAGAVVKPWALEWLPQREKETYNYVHPKLNVSKQDFFSGDAVGYVYDHDDVHEAVKHLASPAYTYFKADGADVYTDHVKFLHCSRNIQLFAVLEEAYVLAIERSLVPFPGVLTPAAAFLKALEKVCTSITSGWFREFAWENYFAVIDLYREDYWYRFELAVKRGLVRPHQGLPGTSGSAG